MEPRAAAAFTIRDWFSSPGIKPAKTLDEMIKSRMEWADKVEVKSEDRLVEMVDPAVSSALARLWRRHSRNYRKHFSSVHDAQHTLCDLVEDNELFHGECLAENVDLTLTDPLLNACRVQ